MTDTLDLDNRWMDRAACKGTTTADWFPAAGDVARARNTMRARYCDSCPVAAECLQWALDMGELGIWAGTSERERRRYLGLGPKHRIRQARQCVECRQWWRPSPGQNITCSDECQQARRARKNAEYWARYRERGASA